jgi:hypothetical protein
MLPIQVFVSNNGLDNETVSVTVFANGKPVATLTGIFLQACPPQSQFCFYNYSEILQWDTAGYSAGNYTISATVSLPAGEVDPTPADNSLTDGMVTVLPPPVVTLDPVAGQVGTKVTVQGTGFISLQQYPYYYPTTIYVEFDNMLSGFVYTSNGSFTFVFDVPVSQLGSHQVYVFDPNSGAHASATFTVQPTPTGSLAVSIDMGTIYFHGDTAVAYILTTFNGVPTEPQNVQLQVVLFRPDGTNLTMAAQSIGTGLYKASYTIPSTSLLGTYLVSARAHEQGPFDASAIAAFEVKLPWLSSNFGRLTVAGASIAGVVGLVGFAWNRGYLKRRKEDENQISSLF